MTNRVHELLSRAQDLIRDPAHWTKGASARLPNGRRCSSLNEDAVCFCTYGAIERATLNRGANTEYDLTIWALRNGLHAIVGHRMAAQYNDEPHRTHAEVMAVFDRAKELALADAV